MKKNKLYTVNRPVFMPNKNLYGFGGGQDDSFDNAFITGISPTVSRPIGSWNAVSSSKLGPQVSRAGVPGVTGLNTNIDFDALNGLKQNIKTPSKLGLQLKNFAGSQLGGTAIGLAGSLVGQGLNSAISNGLSSGVGNTVSSLGSTIGGAVGAVNPLLGGIISAGSGLLGGLANAAFGSKMNEDNIADIESNITDMRSLRLNGATSNNDLLNKWGSVDLGYNFDKSYIGKDGWFSNKAGKKFRSLQNQQNAAREYAKHQLMTAANQADRYQDDLAQSTFVYSDGGGIHIDPSKKGTFTAAASKHGMGVQEFASKVLANKEDYSPTMVKKANFAKNAAKWHDYGGPLNYLNTGALGIMQNDKYLDAINHRSDVLAKNAGVQYSSYTPGTYAFGGELGTNGTDWTNGLLYVDNGGTHQQNPLGGVPVGFDQNGTPNLVEEGETIWNDYVFSNRIKVPKAMFYTLGLGGAMKKNKLTFADASKKLAKESEQRPNDHISMAGLEASLSKLAAVQEAERMKKQMRQSVGLENMAAYGGPVNKFVGGGDVKNTNIPAEYQGTYQDIVNWLMENNLEASDAAVRKYAKDFYSNKSLNSNRASAYKWLSDNTDYNQAVITKLADLMAKRPSANMSGNFSPEDAFDSLIPTRLFTEGNIEKYLKNFMDNGLSFDDAWNVVNHSTPKEESLQQRRYNAQLQARLRDKYDKGLSPVADSISPEEVPEEVSTNPNIEWGIQNAMQEAARNEAPQAQQERTAGNTSSGTGYTVTPGVRSQNGIIPYGYYTNGSDGYSTPTGFKVGENGRAYDYTQEYRDLVSKLGANDIRKWASEHKDDPSLQSFIARGNNLDNLTDEQWRTGALDGKYGFMHHVANSILNGDYTPTSAMEDPGPLDRTTRGPLASSPNTNVTIKNPLEQAAVGNGTGTTNPPQDEFNPLPTWMRYAPVLGGAVSVLGDMLGLTNKPDYTYADRLEAAANAAGYAPTISPQPIGDYIRYNPFDRLFYANQLQANARATDRALANTSSPSRAAGLLANAYNTTNNLGNLYRQGDEYNLAQRQQTADFNRRTNMFNSQMGLEAAMANARYRQAAKQYQLSGLAQAASLRNAIDQRVGAARSANLTNLFNSIGDIGRENMSFNMVNSTSAANNGYWIDKNGVVHYTNRDKKA